MAVKIAGCALMAGCGGSDSGSVLQIASVNGDPARTVALLSFTYQPTSPAGGRAAQYSAEGLPAWAGLDSTTGAIKGTPGPDDVSAYQPFTLTAITNAGATVENTVLRVLPTDAYLSKSVLAFDATDYDGHDRPLRNDLSEGSLRGAVTFAQSHTDEPNHNFVRDGGDETRSVYKPRLVALRDALLLFTPDTAKAPVTVGFLPL